MVFDDVALSMADASSSVIRDTLFELRPASESRVL